MIVSLRPIAVLRRAIPRPFRVAWRARKIQKPSADREVKPRVGFFQSYQRMLEHQAEIMIGTYDK